MYGRQNVRETERATVLVAPAARRISTFEPAVNDMEEVSESREAM